MTVTIINFNLTEKPKIHDEIIDAFQVIFPLFKRHHEEIDQQARIVHDSFMEKLGKFIYNKPKKW